MNIVTYAHKFFIFGGILFSPSRPFSSTCALDKGKASACPCSMRR